MIFKIQRLSLCVDMSYIRQRHCCITMRTSLNWLKSSRSSLSQNDLKGQCQSLSISTRLCVLKGFQDMGDVSHYKFYLVRWTSYRANKSKSVKSLNDLEVRGQSEIPIFTPPRGS